MNKIKVLMRLLLFQTCPNDYIFDPKLSVCTPPASASCQSEHYAVNTKTKSL